MRRRFLTLWVVALVALAALVVAGCGGSDATDAAAEATTPAAESTLSAEEIVTQSMAAMEKVTSGSFTADVSLAVEGDPAKMTDPTAKQLTESPITLHAEGASSDDPVAADMDMTIGLMGQNLALSMLVDGEKAWVEYDGTWYAVPEENTKSLGEEASSGALPTEQLKDLGIDIESWDVTWELAGTETVDGADCYRLSAQPDVAKMTDSIMKALEDPKVLKQLGGDEAAQIQSLEQQNSKELEQLKESLKDVTVELWIETESLMLRKGALAATMDMTKMEDAQGIESMAIETDFTLGGFDEAVEVDPPAKAEKLDLLMDQLVGGMMGGMMGETGGAGDMSF